MSEAPRGRFSSRSHGRERIAHTVCPSHLISIKVPFLIAAASASVVMGLHRVSFRQRSCAGAAERSETRGSAPHRNAKCLRTLHVIGFVSRFFSQAAARPAPPLPKPRRHHTIAQNRNLFNRGEEGRSRGRPEIDANGNLLSANLDLKNPSSAAALEHLPPERLVEDILARERRIIEIMHEIKAELAGTTEAAA